MHPSVSLPLRAEPTRRPTLAEEIRARIDATPASRKIVVAARDRRGRIEYRSRGYSELAAASRSAATGLSERGVGPGTRTLVLVKPGFDLFAVMLALVDVGAVPVLVDPGLGLKQMVACVRDAGVEAMIAEPRAFLLRLLAPGSFSALRTAVSTGSIRVPGAIPLATLYARGPAADPVPRRPDDVCMIAYTSGSTGPSKGVEMTYGNVAATCAAFRTLAGDDDGMDLVALPPLALVSLVRGRSLVMPDIDYAKLARARPADLVHAIETHDVTTSFGSPIVFRNLARYCSERRITLSSMKRMFCAGAPVGPETLRQLASVLPQTSRIWTPYGATEAMPLCAIDADEVLQETAAATRRGAGTCVGRPLDGTRVKVIRLTDRAVTRWDSALELGPGEVGELVAQGTQVTSRYFRNPRADRLAKIVETTPDGAEVVWHRTGDVGRFDDRGRVWLHGRTKHVVRHRGETYYPVCVEGIFNAEPGVRRTALIGYRGKRGAELVLVVEPDPATRPRTARSWRDALLAVGRRHGIPLTRVVFRRRPLPTDRRHNSKIERLALSRWARKRYG